MAETSANQHSSAAGAESHAETVPTSGPSARVYLETYGCQMNIADSQLVNAVLRRAGYGSADKPEDADIILINTCAIREHAEARVIGRLSDLARLKRARPELKLGLLGCMAQHNRATLIAKAPWLDLVAGPDTYRRLPELIGRSGFDPAVDVRLERGETYAGLSPDYEAGVRAYITIMRGCDKFCAFCVVPYVRGRERSVPADSIVHEVEGLAVRGFKEVVLLGQTVNAYRAGEVDFAALLRKVAAVNEIERIRFTSPHPSDMSEATIEVMASEPKVQPYLHLPVQSGSDRILAAMERGYTVSEYLDLVERLRAAIPGLALSTDIIVGFHGETESDFQATLKLVRTVRYDSAFSFKYSVREHTRAHRLGDSVSEEEKGRRLAELIAMQEAISLERNRELIGETFPVLVEGPARRGEGRMAGKTPQFKTTVFAGDAGRTSQAVSESSGMKSDRVRAGDTVGVRIESATGHSLTGVIA
jgi:tRNA-2-methylthio-N6-dimethylallyladenosine synthase